MLRVDTNYLLRAGFINDGIFYPIRDLDVEAWRPTLKATQNALILQVQEVTYTFLKKHLSKFYWWAETDTITFEWDYNSSPKLYAEKERTTRNPLKLTTIECNALSFVVHHKAKSGSRKDFKPFQVKSVLLPVVDQKQHQLPIPDDIPLIVGLYLETLSPMYIPRGRITPNFYKILRGATVDEAVSALMMLRRLGEMILNPAEMLQVALKNLQDVDSEDWPSTQEKNRQNNDTALVFQVEVTPTKTYVTGPFLERANRVLRKYTKWRNHFVRVRFCDEDGSPLNGLNAGLQNYVRDKLKNGISLAGRNYTFLAWSNSQLKGHSCFLFTEIACSTSNYYVTNREIIDELGVFWDDSVPKIAARIGQCFTATVGGIRISIDKCEVIDDVERNGYVFSDGVGTASFAVMELVQRRLKLQYVPSAIQIRYGGSKGVLSLDNRLLGLAIRIRPSMQKFDSSHKELEIIAYSTYRTAFLNRPMITLLQSLGTPNEALEELENNTTSKIDELLAGFVDEETLNQITWGHSKAILQKTLQTFGFNDGFLRALINKHSSKALRLLQTKTRIQIPNSAYAMGILDEYDCLEENEVFYQGLTDTGEEIRFEGEVLVTRSPSLHGGDVRHLEAVWKYDLAHLHNVVVFSAKGRRPVPDMISGGDLDGDHYSIIAERSIFPEFIVPPMKGRPKKKKYKSKDLSWPDAYINYFVHFMANDNLGKVANQWLAQCEIQERRALSPIATKISEIHSIIVDFPKTGMSAKLPDYCKTSVFPHYMGKSRRNSFVAEDSFIGQSEQRTSEKYGNPFLSHPIKLELDDDLSSYPGNEYWEDDASSAYQMYCDEMKGLIKAFGAISDVDIVTGILPPSIRKRCRGKKSGLAEKLSVAFEDLKTRYLKLFKKGTNNREDKLEKASAWYRAAYESSDPVFASFAWILTEYLVEVKENRAWSLRVRRRL